MGDSTVNFTSGITTRMFSNPDITPLNEPAGHRLLADCASTIDWTSGPVSLFRNWPSTSSEVFVDLDNINIPAVPFGLVVEQGTELIPFNTMAEAFLRVSEGGTIKILSSTSPNPVGMVKRCSIRSEGGTSTLGED
jgi:hypothetical protein